MRRKSLQGPTVDLILRPVGRKLEVLPPLSPAEMVLEEMVKGATVRQAAERLRMAPTRAAALVKKVIREYGLQPADYRLVSLETLGRLAEELWRVYYRNPWRTTEYLLRIVEQQREIMGSDRLADPNAVGETGKIPVQLIQQIIVQVSNRETRVIKTA